jgi:hypothetical protein
MGLIEAVPEHYGTEKRHFIALCEPQLDFLVKIMVTVPEACSEIRERETP